MGRPGHKRRDRETQDDIKAGRQLRLFLYESIDDPTSSMTTSVDPLPIAESSVGSLETAVIHEVLDEEDIFVERFHYGNLLADKIEAARASLRHLLRLREASCPQKPSRKESSIKKKRISYSEGQRQSVIDLFERLPGKLQDRIAKINSIPGYEKISHKNIRGWGRPKKKLGRCFSAEFENEVAADLIVSRLSESGDTEIIANAIYSYDCVKSAATFVRERSEKWKTDSLTMSLKFSNKWVKGFLNRIHFTKRRVTATIKPETPVPVVQAQMSMGAGGR
jgi:hypothetical protein